MDSRKLKWQPEEPYYCFHQIETRRTHGKNHAGKGITYLIFQKKEQVSLD